MKVLHGFEDMDDVVFFYGINLLHVIKALD